MKAGTHVTGAAALARRLNPDAPLQGALAQVGEDIVAQAKAQDSALAETLKVAVSPHQVDVGLDHPGARAAEFGTLDAPPAPILQPAFQAALPTVRARLRQVLKRYLSR